MPIFYTCKRCKKNYSKKQYNKRVFCRICGSLILSQFVIDPEIKEGSNKSLFFKKKSLKTNLSFHSKENHFLKRAAHNLNNKVKNRKEYSVFSQKEIQALNSAKKTLDVYKNELQKQGVLREEKEKKNKDGKGNLGGGGIKA